MTQRDEQDPEAQALMAAVIRLASRCATQDNIDAMRTLVALLGELRAHPQLSTQPAVLAGVIEAHATWVAHLAQRLARDGSATTADPSHIVVH